MPDINLNTLPETDVQKNRRKMMQNDTFKDFNKEDSHILRARMQLELNSEMAKNRRKVLQSEYDILTGNRAATVSTTTFTLDKLSTTTFDIDPLTPMSTTSDTPMNECAANPSTSTFVIEKSDTLNGNERDSKTQLKVVVTNLCYLSEQPPSALSINYTPECDLTTAGIQAKETGFNFESKSSETSCQSTQTFVNIESPNACSFPDYSQPYQRCIELIESNFQCPTQSPYFRLNKPHSHERVLSISSNISLETKNLNSMSVITLTDFLKKSVIMPMNIHLEIVKNEVMRMYLFDLQIIEHLRSLRHYFFMMDGEFGAIICDGIIGRLEDGASPQMLFNFQMLNSILDTALGSSITGNLIFKDI